MVQTGCLALRRHQKAAKSITYLEIAWENWVGVNICVVAIKETGQMETSDLFVRMWNNFICIILWMDNKNV